MAPQFGILEPVNLRDAWSHEAHDFTPWLAKNLDRLSDALKIDPPLEVLTTEAPVEQFYADILARNPLDDSNVLIENQLEWSDHTHLGQILTYLAGLEVRTIIWVAPNFQEAHLSAIRWLNENTSEPFNFFAVQVKVVRIGDSPMVPIFDVQERPSEWDRRVRAIAQENLGGLSELGQFRSAFWTYYAERYSGDGIRKGFAGINPDYHVEGTGLKIRRYLSQDGVGLWIAKSNTKSSESDSELIEPYLPELANALNRSLESARRSGALSRLGVNTQDRENWPQAVEWLHSQLEIYRAALGE